MTAPLVYPPRRGNYDLVVVAFVGLLLISNVAAVKLIQFGPDFSIGGVQILPIVADGGAFLFPLTYVVGDLIAEVYGLKGSRRAIGAGFVMSVVASLTFLAVGAAPAEAGWGNQEAFDAILGFVPRIVLASLVAYAVGQFLNAVVLVRMKQRAPEGSLWTRLLGSTLVGQAADTVIFCMVAFYGELTAAGMLNYIVIGYVYKVLVEILVMPVTYRAVAFVRSREPAAA